MRKLKKYKVVGLLPFVSTSGHYVESKKSKKELEESLHKSLKKTNPKLSRLVHYEITEIKHSKVRKLS